MEYRVTARKYRPQAFRDVIGQENLVKALLNALESGRIPHAYLFSGARGVGKTTTARILAKSLNCKSRLDGEPCNVCPSCIEITNGSSLDVVEIDGASNRGIDSIRQIRDNVAYRALSGKYRIYIIDEVHMLTKEASNALLKTLEEPPEHVIFILATTEPHNVLPTIRSRCQHYIYKKIPVRTVMAHLSSIAKAENVEADEDGLYLVAAAGDGSMRDAQSIFDQVVLYSDGKLTEATAAEVIGMPENSYFSDLVMAVKTQDLPAMLRVLYRYLETVGDIKLFVRGLLGYLRTALLAKRLPADDELLDLTAAKYQQMTELFASFTSDEISRIMGLFTEAWKDLKGDANEKFELEVALFKMMDYKNIVPLSELRAEIQTLLAKGISPSVQAGISPNVRPAMNEPPSMDNEPPPPDDGEAPIPPAQFQQAFHRQPYRQETPPERAVYQQESAIQKTVAPKIQPEQEAPVQFRKLQVDRPKQELPENTGAPVTGEIDLKAALLKAMNSHIIMKTLTPQVQSVSEGNGGLLVELKSAHSCEYLNQNKADLERAVARIAGRQIPLSFSFNPPAGAEDTRKAPLKTASEPVKQAAIVTPVETVKPREIPPVDPKKQLEELAKREAAVLKPPPVQVAKEAPPVKEDGGNDPAKLIADLFDGKIRK